MAETKTLTAKEILDKKFTKDVKGYDALEVDDFLDRVIKDYQTFQNEIARRDAAIAEEKKQMLALQAQNNTSALETAKQRIHELELENASYKNKLAGIASADPNLNVQNINYIKRIQALESFVWQLGYDPRTLKKRNSWSSSLEILRSRRLLGNQRKVHARTVCDGRSDCARRSHKPRHAGVRDGGESTLVAEEP